MSTTMHHIKAAVEDGRAQSARFKQRQLAALHKALNENQKAIIEAVEKHSKCTNAEAIAQYFLVLDALKSFYDKLDFGELLQDEYSIAHSRDNPDRRTGIGCVSIVPDTYNLLYSAIVPVAAAIAAGNCVVLEIKQTSSELNSLLRQIVHAALDTDTFAVVDDATLSKELESRHHCILDCSQKSGQTVVGVVDRSGDVEKAARELVTARMSFSGKSRYAPDLVLVNEFCVEDFCKFAMQAALPYLASRTQFGGQLHNGKAIAPKDMNTHEKTAVLKDTNATVLSVGDGGSIALARERCDDLLHTKIDEPLLLIHPISSLDDAIDYINVVSNEPLQALYLFSAPSAAKYLSQFVEADISFTNHIPIELLVGPIAPKMASVGTDSRNSLKVEVHPRFTAEMFSIPRPEFVGHTHSEVSEHLSALLQSRHRNTTSVTKLTQATQLMPLKEPEGGAIGFFEQGIITGGTLLLSTIVVGTATVIRYGFPYLARMVKRS